jgi:hypothetical protein
MERHDQPHDRDSCPRCLELRRQEFIVPTRRPYDYPLLRYVLRHPEMFDFPPDPDEDRETLWGEPA